MDIPDFGRQVARRVGRGQALWVIYVAGPDDSGKPRCVDFSLTDGVIRPDRVGGLRYRPDPYRPTHDVRDEPYLPKGSHAPLLRFAGSTQPAGHLLQMLTGAKRLTEEAFRKGAQRVVVDTSDFIEGKQPGNFNFR